jgi:hypothetical protein
MLHILFSVGKGVYVAVDKHMMRDPIETNWHRLTCLAFGQMTNELTKYIRRWRP